MWDHSEDSPAQALLGENREDTGTWTQNVIRSLYSTNKHPILENDKFHNWIKTEEKRGRFIFIVV